MEYQKAVLLGISDMHLLALHMNNFIKMHAINNIKISVERDVSETGSGFVFR